MIGEINVVKEDEASLTVGEKKDEASLIEDEDEDEDEGEDGEENEASVTVCKRCDSAALEGNYGFCASHRQPTRSRAAAWSGKHATKAENASASEGQGQVEGLVGDPRDHLLERSHTNASGFVGVRVGFGLGSST